LILHTLSFFARVLRRVALVAAALTVALPPLAWAAADNSPWGRLITSAAIVCNSSTHKIYAVNESAGSLTVTDSVTNSTHTIQVGREPIAIAINHITNRIYVANGGSASVSVIDGTKEVVVATVASAALPYMLAVDETSNRIYVTHTYSGTVTEIDGASNTSHELKVGDADGIVIDPATSKVFLSTYEDPNIRILNESTGATIKVAVGPHTWGMIFDQSSFTLFLAHTAAAEVVALDEKMHAVTTIPVGKIPCALAIDPITHRLYVVNYGDETLSVIDLQTKKVLATLPVGRHPQGIAVDLKSHRIYVANVLGNSVTVIDGAKNKVLYDLSAGDHPYAVAIDSVFSRVYAANYSTPWITPIAERK
jgi:YVTN family beta-propeller protein